MSHFIIRTSATSLSLLLLLANTAWGADAPAPAPAMAQPAATAPQPAATPAAPASEATPPATSEAANIKDNLALIGMTYTLNEGKLDMLIDQKKVLTAAPALSKEDVIVKLSADDLKKAPNTITIIAIAIPFNIILLPDLYKQDPKLDKLHVDAYVLPADSTKKELCYSFDYDAKANGKLDLDKMNANTFVSSTPGFKLSPWCRALMEKEEKDAG